MNTIRAIEKLNKRELDEGVAPEASWHTDYRDTAFIYVGGLPFELSEGDVVVLFSQYGEPVWVKLARDRETGKSRGFGWLKYEDQRSTDLAVDNLGGATLMGRVLQVDHTRYKPGKDEDMRDNTYGEPDAEQEDDARRKRQRTDSGSEDESDEDRPLLKEEIELEKLVRDLDEDDPMKPALVRKKRDEVEAALAKWEKARRKEKERAKKEKERAERHRRHRERDPKDRGREHKHIRDHSEHKESKDHPRSRRRDESADQKADPDSKERSERERRRHSPDGDERPSHRRHHSSDEPEDRPSRSKHSPRHDRSPDGRERRRRDGD